MKKTKKPILAIAIVAVLAVALTACLPIIGSVLGSLADFMSTSGYGEHSQFPEGTVYGSDNDLAVGFVNGVMTAFWDVYSGETYALTIVEDEESTEYSEESCDYFGDGSFNLEQAQLSYSDDFDLILTRTYKNEKEQNKYSYSGISSSDYIAYAKNVPGGFRDIDYYVATRYELFEFFSYLIIFRPNAKQITENGKLSWEVEASAKIGYDFQSLYGANVDKGGAFSGEIAAAVDSFEDSAGYSYAYELNDATDVATFRLKFEYSITPEFITDTNLRYYNAHSAVTYNTNIHYSLGDEPFVRKFPIDDWKYSVSVTSGEQLYYAIKKGYKPNPVPGSNADLLYTRMRYILSFLNEDEDEAHLKVHKIYDYIVNTVVYDYNFVDRVLNDGRENEYEYFSYKCLYLEGVFGLTNEGTFSNDERVAICDGLSKAFLCMAEIEGITALKISGTAGSDNGAHAWNKVRIGGTWYMVDTTWGNALQNGAYSEYITHGYVMVPDDENHHEDPWFYYPPARTRYPLLGTNI